MQFIHWYVNVAMQLCSSNIWYVSAECRKQTFRPICSTQSTQPWNTQFQSRYLWLLWNVGPVLDGCFHGRGAGLWPDLSYQYGMVWFTCYIETFQSPQLWWNSATGEKPGKNKGLHHQTQVLKHLLQLKPGWDVCAIGSWQQSWEQTGDGYAPYLSTKILIK